MYIHGGDRYNNEKFKQKFFSSLIAVLPGLEVVISKTAVVVGTTSDVVIPSRDNAPK